MVLGSWVRLTFTGFWILRSADLGQQHSYSTVTALTAYEKETKRIEAKGNLMQTLTIHNECGILLGE